MNNLTDVLNADIYQADVKEQHKLITASKSMSGREYRHASTVMPSYELDLSYQNLSVSQFDDLLIAFENNYGSIIRYYAPIDDIRKESLSGSLEVGELSVWAFSDFEFECDAKTRKWSGKISLIASNQFDSDLLSDAGTSYLDNWFSSSYSPSEDTTSNSDKLINMLADIQPYRVKIGYQSTVKRSAVGAFISRSKSSFSASGDGVFKRWDVAWLVREADYVELVKVYRQLGGGLKTSNMPEVGFISALSSDYLPSKRYVDIGYVEDDYLIDYSKIKARFGLDGLNVQRSTNGFYHIEATIEEVK